MREQDWKTGGTHSADIYKNIDVSPKAGSGFMNFIQLLISNEKI